MIDAAGLTKFRNKKDRMKNGPSLSGVSKGQVTRKVGVSAPGGPPMEMDERPTRQRIEQDRRPLNYGKDRPQYRPDMPDVVKKPATKNVTRKPASKPKKFKGKQATYGGSRA